MKPLKVSEVNNYIKRIFAGDMILSNIEIEGEISNYNKHYSGHLYFSLKDDKGIIKCVMFRSDAKLSNVDLVEGQKIIAKGYISIYEKSGAYQLYVKDISNKGVGELYREYELLKKKLETEGLFKEKYKKDIPFMPKKIGIVTSATGAVIKDIITVVNRRFPSCNILIYPSLVQGQDAPSNIIKGIKYLDSREDIDVIIIGRGGGSIDELFAFNDENLARAIFHAETPIISAVGHETDYTISDFVADLRAATPSAAAEMAVPHMEHLYSSLRSKYRRLINDYEKWIKLNRTQLEIMSQGIKYNNPIYKVRDRRQELDMVLKDINSNLKDIINNRSKELLELEKRLEILNPSISLEKGRGILLNKDGHLIKSIFDVSIDEELKIVMKDGSLNVAVQKIEGGSFKDGNK